MDKKAICALILGCKPQELMGYKDYGAFVAVLDPQGRKFVYTAEHLWEQERRMTKDEGRKTILTPAPAKNLTPNRNAKKTVPTGQSGSKSVAKRPAKASNPKQK